MWGYSKWYCAALRFLVAFVTLGDVTQAPGVQLQEEGEGARPEDTARAARKVWELREQMTQQAAHHRRVRRIPPAT